jgi:hypothetical protein
MMEWFIREMVVQYGPWAMGWGLFIWLAWRTQKDAKSDRDSERERDKKIIDAYNAAMIETTKAMTHQTVLFDERTRVFEKLADAFQSLGAKIDEVHITLRQKQVRG